MFPGCALVSGVAGSGKTLLCQMAAGRLAENSLKLLQDQRRGIADIAVPIYLTISDVAVLGLRVACQERIGVVLRAENMERRDMTAFDQMVRHIPARLTNPHTYLFLDALEDGPDRSQLGQRLRSLAEARCRIIVTSRPHGYDRGKLLFPSLVEYELAPLTTEQRHRVIENWFNGDALAATRAETLMKADPRLDEATRNALVLTLACAAVEQSWLAGTGSIVGDVAGRVVRDMTRAVWKPGAKDDDERISLLMALVRSAMGELLWVRPAARSVRDDELIRAVKKAGVENGLVLNVGGILCQLRRGGLIEPQGGGESGLSPILSFLLDGRVASECGSDWGWVVNLSLGFAANVNVAPASRRMKEADYEKVAELVSYPCGKLGVLVGQLPQRDTLSVRDVLGLGKGIERSLRDRSRRFACAFVFLWHALLILMAGGNGDSPSEVGRERLRGALLREARDSELLDDFSQNLIEAVVSGRAPEAERSQEIVKLMNWAYAKEEGK